MAINLNLFIEEQTNELLEDFKKRTHCKNKSEAIDKIIRLGYLSYTSQFKKE